MIPLHSNHRDMGKFESNDDQNYALLRSCINRLMVLTRPSHGPNNVSPNPSHQVEGYTNSAMTYHSNSSEFSSRTSSGHEIESIQNGTSTFSISTPQTSPIHFPETLDHESIISQLPSTTQEDFKELVVHGDVAPVKSFIETISDTDQVCFKHPNAVKSEAYWI